MSGNTAEYPDQPTGLPAENAAQQALADPEAFWSAQGRRLDWFKPFTHVRDVSYDSADVHIRWFHDGILNAAYNCLDRHLAERGEQIAIIWEGDDPSEQQTITYRELHRQVCQCANALKALGVQKGDRVAIYLPMIPQAAVVMLACARIGAIHSVVFAGFSAAALAGRIRDSGASILITADEGIRGGRHIPLKTYAEEALEMSDSVRYCLVVKRSGAPVIWNETRDRWFHKQLAAASADCPAEPVEAEHPLFILYTAGSTSKPKGVLHTTGGYLVAVALSHQTVFDYRPGEVYWCTADIGWVTGHSSIVYGPLVNGATTLMYEGVPNYPDESRFWAICDKHQVNIFYGHILRKTAAGEFAQSGDTSTLADPTAVDSLVQIRRRSDAVTAVPH